MNMDPGEHDDPDYDPAEIDAEVEAARFDDDPNPYLGTDDDGGAFDE